MKISKVKLEIDTLNLILQYLSGKPYIEVSQLINKIHKEVSTQMQKVK